MKKLSALKTSILVVIMLSVFGSVSVFAQTLSEAKAQGLVGEKLSGYLGAPKKPSAKTQALIDNINQKRKAHYQKIAKKVGESLTVVETQAGKKAIDKTSAGNYIEKSPGQWAKK